MVVLKSYLTREPAMTAPRRLSRQRRTPPEIRICASCAYGNRRRDQRRHWRRAALLGRMRASLIAMAGPDPETICSIFSAPTSPVPHREGKAERLRILSSQVERLERDHRQPECAAGAADLILCCPAARPAAAISASGAYNFAAGRKRMTVELAAKPKRTGQRCRDPVYEPAVGTSCFVASRSVNDNGAGGRACGYPARNR